MRYILSFFALVWLVCNQANADGITWSRSIISASNSLPSSTNTSVYTTTLSKYSPLSPNFSWRINDTFGDCSAVTLSPSYGNFISSVDVTVQVNWTLYNVVTTSQCTIVAQTTDGQTALLTVNIAVTSTLCNYQPDPFRFCKAKHLSVNVYCKNDTGVCTCTENHFGLICQFCDPSVTCSGRGTCDQNAKCVCEPGYYGGDCSVTCNRTTNCSGKGNCLPDGSCKCDNGFVSRDCSIQCSRAVNCSKAGDCRADGTCTCDWYAFGDKCQYKKCPKCVHGTCNNSTGLCECEQNYYGADCSKFCTAQSTCSNNGVCSASGSCTCNTNYYGTNCSRFCEAKTTCSDAGECSLRGTCRCDIYFFGSNCSIYCNARTSCSFRGTCSATGCTCNDRFYGDKCQFTRCPTCSAHGTCNPQTGICDCEANWFTDTCNFYCSREETCNGHGTCNRYGECICDDNYYGLNCTHECSATTCLNGYCTSSGGCKCNLGYYGPRCNKYCSSSTCDMGTCDQNTGTCTCFSNYFGSECRTRCVASECLNGGRCDENGACVNDGAITGSENDSLSTGAIAGIIVAGVAGIVIAVVVIVVIARKRKARVEYVDGYQLLNTKK